MNEINLNYLKLKTFTEQDALDYCILNNINSENITELYLFNNELTDISGVKIFKNLETLDISNNEITDISIIMNFKNLKTLDISYLELESDQIKYIKSLKNLAYLWCKKGFKNISGLNQLNKNIKVIK